MAGWMSAGTKGLKSEWVSIAVKRSELDKEWFGQPTLREVIEWAGGAIYGEG